MEAVILDFGGVVIQEQSERLNNDIQEAFGLLPAELRQAYAKTMPAYQRGFTDDEEFWQEFSTVAGKPLPLGYNKLFVNSYEAVFHEDVLSLIEKLKGRVKLGCISNTIMPHALYHKARGHYSMFDQVVLSCEVGLVKPDIRIFELMCRLLDAMPHECVFIDDNTEMMKGAIECGMKTIHYTGPESLRGINV